LLRHEITQIHFHRAPPSIPRRRLPDANVLATARDSRTFRMSSRRRRECRNIIYAIIRFFNARRKNSERAFPRGHTPRRDRPGRNPRTSLSPARSSRLNRRAFISADFCAASNERAAFERFVTGRSDLRSRPCNSSHGGMSDVNRGLGTERPPK